MAGCCEYGNEYDSGSYPFKNGCAGWRFQRLFIVIFTLLCLSLYNSEVPISVLQLTLCWNQSKKIHSPPALTIRNLASYCQNFQIISRINILFFPKLFFFLIKTQCVFCHVWARVLNALLFIQISFIKQLYPNTSMLVRNIFPISLSSKFPHSAGKLRES